MPRSARHLFAAAFLLIASPAFAVSYKVIHDFSGAGDGRYPLGDLVVDTKGRLYGTTYGGNPNADGDVFSLTPPAKGSKKWTEKILHAFGGGGDGAGPQGGVLLGPSGELYGTTSFGGTYHYGTVFRLDEVSGNWVLTPLHQFKNPDIPNDGGGPLEGLAFGPDGNLYGTTYDGGDANEGTVFSVSPLGDTAEYAVLHSFGIESDGQLPYPGRLGIDRKGDLFGTTYFGGPNGHGIAYRLSPPTKKGWKETILRSFEGGPSDVSNPPHGIALGEGNVIYGCASGGANDMGAVYALTPPPRGSKIWGETILYNFGGQPNDPAVSFNCGVAIDPSGRIFGTASGGGEFGLGAFFELDPPTDSGAAWTETVLHNFGDGADGQSPVSPPVKWKKIWYGATSAGGANGAGVAYQIKP